MSRYRIVPDRESGCWRVYKLGDFPRHVAEFPTLIDAEDWVCGRRARCAGRRAVAHEPTMMVDGACPVCGEVAS
jgi:hypothetical protein